MITRKRLKEVLHYDPDTGRWTWLVRMSHKIKIGDEAGHAGKPSGRSVAVRSIGVDCRLYKSHRLAWFYMTGRWPKEQVDHKDGNSLNDRWLNLRLASRSENGANKGCYRNNKLRLKGIFVQGGRFRAQIQKDGRRISLGYFDTPEEAFSARCRAVARVHGEFARVE